MILALVLAAAVASSPVSVERREKGRTALDAERAFAVAAQKDGQWTAFRRFAADDATMFVPQPTNAQAWLKDRKDPPRAIAWWPTASFVSCDGASAVNTRGWRRPDGNVGYFSTVWERGTTGAWQWRVDGGDALKRARSRRTTSRRASCRPDPTTVAAVRYRDGETGEGMSADRTLAWRWHVAPDGARSFDAWMWNGRTMQTVIADRITIPPPPPIH